MRAQLLYVWELFVLLSAILPFQGLVVLDMLWVLKDGEKENKTKMLCVGMLDHLCVYCHANSRDIKCFIYHITTFINSLISLSVEMFVR